MAEISVAILGLGRLGTSIGLALKRHNAKQDTQHKFKISGFSTISAQVKAAQKLDAIQTAARNAADAVRGCDIAVIAMPYAEVEATYDYIAQDLRSGAVILDFSPLKQPSLEWAKKYLSAEVHVLGVTAVVNPKYLFEGVDDTARASADIFDSGVLLLTPSVTCIPEAIDLGRDFANIVGAESQFIDPAESDSLVAATQSMPALLGVAYYYMLEKNKGWGDIQKLTNSDFGMLTHGLFDTHPDDLRDELSGNRAALVRHIDDFIGVLRSLRATLVENDLDALETVLGDSAKNYEMWYNRRLKNKWDQDATRQPIETPDMLTSFFGGFVANRLRGKRDNESEN